MERVEVLCFSNNLYEIESIIRKYLFNMCNIIRLTRINKYHIFRKKDSKFIDVINHLEPFIIKIERNNMLFNDIPQGNKHYDHYFYTLSKQLINYLDEETLLFDAKCSKHFYGFENPTFYLNNKMVACLISHEDELRLYLTENDIEYFNHEGLNIKSNKIILDNNNYLELVKQQKRESSHN